MTLDLVPLMPQVHDLLEFLSRDTLERQIQLDRALGLLYTLAPEELDQKINQAKNANWLLAEPQEPLATRHPVSSSDAVYAALATDGSSIDVNRHAPAACFVINIGHAWFDYTHQEVELASKAELEFASAQLRRGDHRNASKETVLTGNLLDAYRTAMEMLKLADLAEQHAGGAPIVALLDGQLVLWGLKESELGSEAQDLIFEHGVISALDRLRQVAEGGRLVLGSYISRPGGHEVTNALRIARCPRLGGVDCHDCPRREDGSRPCDEVSGGSDADLFARLLNPSERSTMFGRRLIQADHDHPDSRYSAAGHGLRFFYLHVPGGEVARVEIPEWVAASEGSLDLLHSAILDQCERGGGYPLVLQEAHEQAVIDGAARRSFSLLLDRNIESRSGWKPQSGKAWSKRRRPI
jgi:NurA domain